MNLRSATGHSDLTDAFDAGREAAAEAIGALGGEAPALLIVFTMPDYDLPRLLEGVRSVSGQARLAGATGSGQIIDGSYRGFGGGVSVMAMTAGPYRFGLASASDIRGDLTKAGQDIAARAKAEAGPSPHAALILLADCLSGDLQQLFLGAYKVAGAGTAITGGAAGDELRFKATFVFRDGEVVDRGAVGVWIASEKPLRAATRHGWKPIGEPLLVTRAEGTHIFELGGRPAADVYEEQLGLGEKRLTPENFWDTSMYHPFGLLQPDGSMIIRVARTKTPAGTLTIQACVPPTGSAVQVTEGSSESILSVVEEVARETLDATQDAGALLAFSCAMRAKIMKERTPEEAAALKAVAGETPVLGLYCCGEFARTAGTLGTHNATLTVIAL